MTVQDVTFLANISNLNVTNISQNNPTNTGELASGFSKVLNDISSMQNQQTDAERAIPDTKVSESSIKLDIPEKDTANATVDSSSGGKIRDQIYESEASPVTDEDNAAIENFEQDVKALIEEAFGVSEEEIDDAMAILGLTVADLVDPQSFIELATELTGAESATELLLNDDFKQLFENVASLVEELSETVGVKADELANLFDAAFENEPAFEEFLNNQPLPEEMPAAEMSAAPIPGENANPVNEELPPEIPAQQMQQDAEAKQQTPEEQLIKAENTVQMSEVQEQTVAGNRVQTVSDEALTEDSEDAEVNIIPETAENSEDNESEAGGLLSDDGGEDVLQRSSSAELPPPESSAATVNSSPTTTFQTFVNSATGEQVTQMTQTYVDESGVMEQFVTNVSVNITPETSDLVMQLNPESLGKIYLQVSEQQGAITAKIAVENEAVKDIMAAQMTTVKEALAQNGVKIEAVEVSVRTHEFERNLEEGNHEGNEEKMFEEQEARRPRRSINLNNLDELSGMMTEEEQIVASMMRDSGNTMDVHA